MSLTAGYSYTCAANTGGATSIWLANAADVDTMTKTGDEYSAITMVATKVFYEFEVETDSLEFVENVAKGDRRAYSVEHMANMFFPNNSTDQIASLQDLIDCSPCGLIAVIQDNNGTQRVMGYSETFTNKRSAYVETMEATTGATITDSNGTQVQLKSTDADLALPTTVDMSTLV
jgi:hypothetical protein